MNWTLEVITLPVSNVDRAKAFYADKVGFNVDHDSEFSEEMRVVQLTPPGSGCSIVVGKGLIDSPPGSVKGLQLVVPDVRAARAELVERGVDVSEVEVLRPEGSPPARDEEDELDNVGFIWFSDPDGNRWAVQQISSRA
jgi:catechol 2,3-dioxygenase-like lactoylglutathione lyase family enzyme